MSDLIGTLHPERHACRDVHLPNCYNPTPLRHAVAGCTACQCGLWWWPGNVGTWHSRQIREPDVWPEHAGRPRPGAVIGWDVYFLHAPGCPDDRVTPNDGHTCGDAVPVTAADMWRRA